MHLSSADMVSWTLSVRQKWAAEVGAMMRRREGNKAAIVGANGELINTPAVQSHISPEIAAACKRCVPLWVRYKKRDFRHTDAEVDAQEVVAQFVLRLNAERTGQSFKGWRLANRAGLSKKTA